MMFQRPGPGRRLPAGGKDNDRSGSGMEAFFKVTSLETVLSLTSEFPRMGAEEIPIADACARVLAGDIAADVNLPDFARSTMDGFAVSAASTFGASEANPAYLSVKGTVSMGSRPSFSIGRGEAARIPTGAMLPGGADSVVMIEHTAAIDDATIEAYKSVAPGAHVVAIGEDVRKNDTLLFDGQRIRPQEIGLLAAFGQKTVLVYRKPRVAVISTGDEVVSIDAVPGPGQIRDVNTYTLSGLLQEAGAIPEPYGIVGDDYSALSETCARAVARADMVIISGGSSVGVRDYSIDALSSLPDAHILAHGIAISPGKPTILARAGHKAVWGLPGHVVSAMVVFNQVVRPFIEHIAGLSPQRVPRRSVPAILSRNIASAQGRVDFVRVRLVEEGNLLWAHPILGKSGLINTMVKADGLIEIGLNTEGLDRETPVAVHLL